MKKKFNELTIIYHFRPQASSALFFKYNTQLGPPYHILVDTNFINFTIKNKLDMIQSMMDCLYAKCKYKIKLDAERGLLSAVSIIHSILEMELQIYVF